MTVSRQFLRRQVCDSLARVGSYLRKIDANLQHLWHRIRFAPVSRQTLHVPSLPGKKKIATSKDSFPGIASSLRKIQNLGGKSIFSTLVICAQMMQICCSKMGALPKWCNGGGGGYTREMGTTCPFGIFPPVLEYFSLQNWPFSL